MTAPIPDDADFDELFGAWQSASADFNELVTPLSQEEWDSPTTLPGWTVGDIVSHVGWLEGILIGRFDAAHEPNWDGLPHVTSDFGRLTEIPVDLRRSWTREDVLIELASNVADRRVALDSGPHDVAVETPGPFGPAPLGRVLRMRTLDTWVHEQDVRDALGRPGHLDTLGAQATASQLLPGYGKVWVKLCGAQPGEVLRLRVREPGVAFARDIVVGDDGRAKVVDEWPGPATVTIAMDWSTFLNLSCGRGDATQHRERVNVEGDPARAAVVLDNFRVMI
ncbi:MAG: maleylpyruvate isomerase family mycothiol-dependent enzyme [Actinomycetota bacterium]